ncbi:invasion associated locus B family protein [Kushneria phyllosphaerae]|uniref:Uncharacterized protein n=1 Tax=Kushneria phyllosphaerae TaxID=2100822 RepID=A0A2R8CKD6_9GAMM|nr:invasion associated locus B family protein [Kushneria phyllosphaerae]SPJ33341.1 hypothetical protein KSP9073_01346 [Kushneria phyllosphaerae]
MLLRRISASGILALMATLFSLYMVPTAQAQPQNAPDADIKQFRDWEVRCPKGGGNDAHCTMTQLVNSPSSNRPVMRVVVAYPPEGSDPVMVFLLPLGVRLAPGMQLQVDNGKEIPFPYQVCMDDACRADLPLQGQLLSQLRGGTKATVSMFDPNGKRLDTNISLLGFTDATRAITP